MGKKYTTANQLPPRRRTGEQNKRKHKKYNVCISCMGIYLARQLLGPIQGVQPQILWLTVRHYAISFRGPNCSFQYHVGISFRTESQCDYPYRLPIQVKLETESIYDKRTKERKKKKIKQSLKTQYYNLIFGDQ